MPSKRHSQHKERGTSNKVLSSKKRQNNVDMYVMTLYWRLEDYFDFSASHLCRYDVF